MLSEIPSIYLVATPIGNLSDITFRAIEVLKAVDIIFCEDTRTSKKLLSHYNISTSLQSYHLHNEHKKTDYLLDLVDSGKKIALISDAGTPAISDPGFLILREARKRGISIQVIPGASAPLVSLLLSGFPTDRFIFEGFLPPKKGRKKRIESLLYEERTVIYFESVHRIMKLLSEINQYLGPDRMVAVTRELTKNFEETIRGTVYEVFQKCEEHKQLKGEFVVVIAGVNVND